MNLTSYHLLFTAEVVTPLELDDHSGAALRGTLFEAVWRRFCTNKASSTCAECPLHTICPVSALVAPLREESTRGRDVPRPYVILPPLGKARRYERGDTLIFGITLFGSIIQLLPYIILSLSVLEECGLGHKLQENGWRRGKFHIQHIETYHPITGKHQYLFQEGKPLVQSPTLTVTAADVAAKAATLPTDCITLNFLTPTRLIDQSNLLYHVEFRPLVLRLLQRFAMLETTYGDMQQEEQGMTTFPGDLVRLASEITCQEDTTRWEEVKSYSHRQKSLTPISGFTGKATFIGNLAPFRELLVWGELIHVGKSIVKGNGWYKLETPSWEEKNLRYIPKKTAITAG